MSLADVLRLLVFAEAMVVTGATAVVFALYMRRWRQSEPGEGARPRHVAQVAGGSTLLVGVMGIRIYDQLGTPFNWGLVPYIVALTLLLGGVLDMGAIQRKLLPGRKKRKHRRKP